MKEQSQVQVLRDALDHIAVKHQLIEALRPARDQFAVYAELHRAKGLGHEEKAACNDKMAAMCDAAIAAAESTLAQPEPQFDQLAAVTADRDRLLAALQVLLNVLPSATTHPAISAARAAIAAAKEGGAA